MKAWTCEQVADWLRKKGFGDYAHHFLENEVDGPCLVVLDNETLKVDLHVAKLGHRSAILRAIKEYRYASDNVLELVVLHAAPLVLESIPDKLMLPMDSLDLEHERSAFHNIFKRNLPEKLIQALYDVATVDVVRSLLTAWHIRVLHFSGLGHNGKLCFENIFGGTQLVSAAMWSELLQSSGTKSLQVVFVSSCHSERLARIFVEAGVPHVVAIHSDSRIVDASAVDFAKHFYLSLFSGRTVASAFMLAKVAVRVSPDRHFCRACCCAHLHEKTCKWSTAGGDHAKHSTHECCCKGQTLSWPHDESCKFLLLGHSDDHDVVVFPKLPHGTYQDLTPPCPSNIPAMPKQVVGRQIETHQLVRAIVQGNVAVCTGAAGIGKSSLALAAAHYVLQRRICCPDGVFYVDLEGLDLSAAQYAIARSVGLTAGESASSLDVEVELGTRRCLLVLDNVEQLLDRDEQKCQAWLGRLIATASPNTRFLLASRRCPAVPNVTMQHISISQLPPHSAAELLHRLAPQCTIDETDILARVCGYLPLALHVVGRVLANAWTNLTAQDIIELIEGEGDAGLSNVGEKECLGRCIQSSLAHLDLPLQRAFMALGLFRGSFDQHAAAAVLQSVAGVDTNEYVLGESQSSTSTMLGAQLRTPTPQLSLSQIETATSQQSLGHKLRQLDDKDDALSSESYSLLDLESREEKLATAQNVRCAVDALEELNNWSLLERVEQHRQPNHLSRLSDYRVHETIQRFAEDEAKKTSFESAENHALYLTWRRRFVRHYCMVLATASHKFRYSGYLTLFDEHRSKIESALRIGQQLARESEDLARELQASETSMEDVQYTPIVDVLLYGTLVVRGRFIFRVRLDPQKRLELFETSIQLCRGARLNNCKCGHPENDPGNVVDVLGLDATTTLPLPTFESPGKVASLCECIGVMELLALEVLMLMEMGYAYYDVMEYNKSEYIYRETIRVQKDVLRRTDHSHVAEAMNHLGICLSTRKGFRAASPFNFRNAETLLMEAKAMRERVLGSHHPDYATSLTNLGNFYKSVLQMGSQKDYRKDSKFGWGGVLLKTDDDVKEFYMASLAIREDQLGKDHPQVAQSLNNVALCLMQTLKTPNLGGTKPLRESEAFKEVCVEIETMLNRALDIRRKKLGQNSPDTAATLNNLGNFKYAQGEFAVAEIYCKEALQIRKQIYQEDNDCVGKSLLNVGRILVAQDKHSEAEKVYMEALALQRILKPDSREVGFCLGGLLFDMEMMVIGLVAKIGRCKIQLGQEDEGQRMIAEGTLIRHRNSLTHSTMTSDTWSANSDNLSVERLFLKDILPAETLQPGNEWNIDDRLVGKGGSRLKELEKWSGARLLYHSVKMMQENAYFELIGTPYETANVKQQMETELRALKVTLEELQSGNESDQVNQGGNRGRNQEGLRQRPLRLTNRKHKGIGQKTRRGRAGIHNTTTAATIDLETQIVDESATASNDDTSNNMSNLINPASTTDFQNVQGGVLLNVASGILGEEPLQFTPEGSHGQVSGTTFGEFLTSIRSAPPSTMWPLWGDYSILSSEISNNSCIFEAVDTRRVNKPLMAYLVDEEPENLDVLKSIQQILNVTNHVVEIFGWGRIENGFFAVLVEYGDSNCDELLLKLQSQTMARARCLNDVATSVEILHNNFCVHGNINLRNVVLCEEIGVFKLSQIFQTTKQGTQMSQRYLDGPEFCPPEMARWLRGGHSVAASPSIDIWCLGVFALRLFIRQGVLLEFRELESYDAVLDKITEENFSFEASVRSTDLNKPQQQLLLECLEPNLNKRSLSASPILKLLQLKHDVSPFLKVPFFWTVSIQHENKIIPRRHRLEALSCLLVVVPIFPLPYDTEDLVCVEVDSVVVGLILPFLKCLRRFGEAFTLLEQFYGLKTNVALYDMDLGALTDTILSLSTIHGNDVVFNVEENLTQLVENLMCRNLEFIEAKNILREVVQILDKFMSDPTLVEKAVHILDKIHEQMGGPLDLWGLRWIKCDDESGCRWYVPNDAAHDISRHCDVLKDISNFSTGTTDASTSDAVATPHYGSKSVVLEHEAISPQSVEVTLDHGGLLRASSSSLTDKIEGENRAQIKDERAMSAYFLKEDEPQHSTLSSSTVETLSGSFGKQHRMTSVSGDRMKKSHSHQGLSDLEKAGQVGPQKSSASVVQRGLTDKIEGESRAQIKDEHAMSAYFLKEDEPQHSTLSSSTHSHQGLSDLEKAGQVELQKSSASVVQRGLKNSVMQDMCHAVVKQVVGDAMSSSGSHGAVRNPLYDTLLASVQTHVKQFPARYALSVAPDDVIMHMRLLAYQKSAPDDIYLHAQFIKDDDGATNTEICEVVLVAHNCDSLLDAITRGLSSLKGSIMDADVMTTRDGVTLDRFVVKGSFMPPDRLAELKRRIVENLARSDKERKKATDLLPPHDASSSSGGANESPSLTDPQAALRLSLDATIIKPEWLLAFSELLLGEVMGSSGQTYAGSWRGTRVAVKVINVSYYNQSVGDEILDVYHREVAVVSRLRHPNIVLFLGASIDPPKYCLVFESMENGALTDLIRSRRSPVDFFRIARDIAMGMNYLHLCNIVHLDLKSDSVLLNAFGTAKISDFGLSCVLNDGIASDLTAEKGTYRYMAPEVIGHEPVSATVDVYSFGVILWEMIAKDMPFKGMTPIQAAFAVARHGMRPAFPDNTPPCLRALVDQCWHQTPHDRPTFAAVLDLLPNVHAQMQKSEFHELNFVVR
ncbi:Aste57867_7923 [Aphanomyces stellatus]|uniref:Aste57867_7923 protein n=1 Tax=Aphanomyces stellatus TaxID=120398 RepID=A0A485KJ05_9STRA|nr:hypothetical protein As57867_007893 [Aphanomyces stellatus]VFT84816.1 Aste57867_7923 [Aphanomyces stellatus]